MRTSATFGLSADHLQAISAILAPLSKTCRFWIFGSRARGDHREFSDLDLLIDGPLSATDFSRLKTAFEESSLPVKIDVVRNNDLSDSYRAQVEREKVPFSHPHQ